MKKIMIVGVLAIVTANGYAAAGEFNGRTSILHTTPLDEVVMAIEHETDGGAAAEKENRNHNVAYNPRWSSGAFC